MGTRITLDKANYRPVTILITIDKVYEKLLCNQLNEHFEQILHPFMSAYRKKYSCETTTVRLVEDWKLSLDQGESVCVLSTDMSKAFDSMNHNLLLAKLKAYGLTKSAIELLNSFFTERKNRVKLQNFCSDWKTMTRGRKTLRRKPLRP